MPYCAAIFFTNSPRNPPSMKMRLTCCKSGCWRNSAHQANALCPSCALAGSTRAATVAPDVSVSTNRLRPLINLPPSKPTCCVAVAEFLTLCESRIRVVGSAFFFQRGGHFHDNLLSDKRLYFPMCRPGPTWQSSNAPYSNRETRRVNPASRTRFLTRTKCRSPRPARAICCGDGPRSMVQCGPNPAPVNRKYKSLVAS